MKPTPDVTQALTNLRASTDFRTFLEWIGEGLETARDTCEKHTDNEKLFRAQGQCQVLRAIIETNEQAPKLLVRFRKNPPTK